MHADRTYRPRMAIAVVVVLVAALLTAVSSEQKAAADSGSSCGANINPVVCENSQTSGVTPESVWDVSGAGDDDIQGFTTDISVNVGGTVNFKIDTSASHYTIDIYRLGYYGGNGARRQAPTINVTNTAPNQPTCVTDPSVSLVDCGNWAVSASWTVPTTAVSGVYVAHLTRSDNHDDSLITFIVRNDASTSDIIYQTSDETWEAYNRYGQYDFYTGSLSNLYDSPSRARKVSYNRPFATRADNSGRDFLFSNEYPTIRFLEENGYDVSYMAGVDVDRYGSLVKNHKVYLSVGHDEYWSGNQRANVEAARDAGVNLMFLSGNEVYWHTRFEPSIDGSNTAYRTLVCYKETWDNAPTDPTGTSTATWRDPRFGLAPGGSNPENGLTGTMYMSNSDDLPVTVTKAQAQTRLWRNTGLAGMSGTSTALAPHTVGYESDEDIDNGFRPAGLIDLSTTVGSTPQELQDFGNVVLPGTTTHHLTLYRAASGALVFGAGTIQWGWGLDGDHDGDAASGPADPRMQQATVNMLADMNVQPSTLMSGLVPATASTDTQPPTSTITSPISNASIANGTKVTVTGTATDNGGGQVAGVEVSIDGGASWHPATGTTSWSYTGVIHGSGPVTIKSRASDDSANLETPSAGVTVTTGCPCSLFGNSTPKTPDAGDASANTLGVRFTSSTAGFVTGVRFYKSAANTGTHTGTLWNASGTALATGTFTGETASGWQTLTFANPVAIAANTPYVVGYYDPSGHYSDDQNYFYYRDYAAAPLAAPANTPSSASVNGLYAAGNAFPTQSYMGSNYYVDAVFASAMDLPPAVTAQTPGPGASNVAVGVTPSVTFSKPMNASTVTFTLKTSSGATVPSTVAYNATSNTATLTPSAPLNPAAQYTATVNATDATGEPLSAPVTWLFTTSFPNGPCPCTIFGDSWTPATASANDTSSTELGVRFTAATDGLIQGVRFYKGAANTGVHTGSLWSASGTRLATATFSGESATGWQTAMFSQPVAVTGGTTYIASYHAPVGGYAYNPGAFTTNGVNAFPLQVPVNGAVYAYASSSVFPATSSSSNYGVDVIFTVPSSVVPTVTSTWPADGATGVPASRPPQATFNTSVQAGSATMSVTGPGGAPVSGTVGLDSTQRTLTFRPTSQLALGTPYTVTVSGALSLASTVQASSVTWSFTTGGVCPCSAFDSSVVPTELNVSDPEGPVELGMVFSTDTAGYASGVRFYKGSSNTGTHTGSLWSSSGALLATVTFTNESASGWQTALFSQPVPVSAGTNYVVSYHTASGFWSVTRGAFTSAGVDNPPLQVPAHAGRYVYGGGGKAPATTSDSNYFVDVVFYTGTPSGPTGSITSTSPSGGSTAVATSTTLSATFSGSVDASSIGFNVVGPSGPAVAGAVSFNSTSHVATFTPNTSLAAGTTYTATVTANDPFGTAISPVTWSFTTGGVCPCSVFDSSMVPTELNVSDPEGPVELGMVFSTDTAGYATGVRFYKGSSNTGTHTGSLWSSTGTLLATVTFTNESASGWQTALFSQPVPVSAGTNYVVSYHTASGFWSVTRGVFSSAGVDNPPLHVPAHAGRYVYGSGGTAPTGSSDANYFVDVVFRQTLGGS